MKHVIYIFLFTVFFGCGKSVNYSEEFKTQTTGKYLYNLDDIIEVYYKDNKPYLKWRGGTIEPVVIDTNEIFVADLYQKLRFVENPKTGDRYLSIIPKENPDSIRFDYLKVPDTYKTPSTYLKEKNWIKAQEGFASIRAKDSASPFVRESDFNWRGYQYLRDKNYDDAIGIFKMNAALFPDSDNVYDSLADAYLRSGDSIAAFENYSKAYELNSGNERAENFIKAYKANNK